MDLISIVVPVYNREKYIVKCLTSLLNQDYSNIEILVVDDSSTDSSSSLIKEISLKDCRVKYISIEKNKGVSNARNVGITNANGKYIAFCDSDDWVENNYISSMYNFACDDVDLVGCGCFCDKYNENLVLDRTITCSISETRENTIENISEDFFYLRNSSTLLIQSSWAKLFKLDIIRCYNLKFRTDLICNEDYLFNLEYLRVIKKYRFIPSITYHYFNGYQIHEIVRRNKFDLVLESDCIYQSLKNLQETIKTNVNFDDKLKELMYWEYAQPIQGITLCKNRKEKMKIINHLMNSKGFNDISTMSRKYRICVFLYKIKLKRLSLLLIQYKAL